LPRFSFCLSATNSIEWSFNRHPQIGEAVTLGDRGIFLVVEKLPPPPETDIDAEYRVERLRDTTVDDLNALYTRGVNELP
jgi:hypothetical protein